MSLTNVEIGYLIHLLSIVRTYEKVDENRKVEAITILTNSLAEEQGAQTR